MTKLRTSAIALALAATAAAGVTGCSGSDSKKAPTAKDAWNKAQDTLGTYKSLEAKGEGTSDGKASNLTLKGDIDGDPLEASGTLEGATFDMIKTGSKQYMKGDAGFWKNTSGGSEAADKLKDAWIEMPASASSSSNSLSFSDMIKETRDDSSDGNKKLLSDKATVTADKVGDQDAWKIESEDKKVQAWVSQDDDHAPLKTIGLDSADSSSSGEMTTTTFVSHDKDYGIKAPSGAKSLTDIMKSAS